MVAAINRYALIIQHYTRVLSIFASFFPDRLQLFSQFLRISLKLFARFERSPHHVVFNSLYRQYHGFREEYPSAFRDLCRALHDNPHGLDGSQRKHYTKY